MGGPLHRPQRADTDGAENLRHADDPAAPARRCRRTRGVHTSDVRRSRTPAVLNFASARNPGGGFRNGAQAQEESLARASAMYPCLLKAGAFYDHHRADPNLLYTDRIIYAPAVPVFRDDKGRLLPTAYPASFLVSAAPNRSAITLNQPEHLPEIRATLARRAARVLRVAAAHDHRELVLGAWGCGVFGNDPAEVARVFAEALAAGPRFDLVVFAVLDRTGHTRKAFEDALAG
ncbi:TIGR02452 family protein [Actinoplanes sp. HUAS TT8]|uniref:TIGR02452 family protein n=1 Tax=Actinoplanes sp. HUAS TT8 TaxID=3447453 RepID=UPI003F524BE3